jgi:subtilase family serine protease
MMRIKSILLVIFLLTLTTTQPQAKATRNLPAPPPLPDYVVVDVSTSDYDSVKVRVKNQGVITATPCYLALTIKTSAGKTKVFSPKVNGLPPGQETEVVVKTGLDLIQADYEALVDRSNTVKESDETNNTRKGKFGGKP